MLLNNIVLTVTFWFFLWYLYLYVFKIILKKEFLRIVLFRLPRWTKCYFLPTSTNPLVNCDEGDIDIYSTVHVLIYVTLGIVSPNRYFLVLILSVLFEYIEYLVGVRGRWWQDPLMNMIGYIIGSKLSNNKKVESLKEKVFSYFDRISVLFSFCLLFLYASLILHLFTVTIHHSR